MRRNDAALDALTDLARLPGRRRRQPLAHRADDDWPWPSAWRRWSCSPPWATAHGATSSTNSRARHQSGHRPARPLRTGGFNPANVVTSTPARPDGRGRAGPAARAAVQRVAPIAVGTSEISSAGGCGKYLVAGTTAQYFAVRHIAAGARALPCPTRTGPRFAGDRAGRHVRTSCSARSRRWASSSASATGAFASSACWRHPARAWG